MSEEEPKPEQPQIKSRYKAWEHTSPEEVAMSRLVIYAMVVILVILLGSLTWGALK